MLSRRAWPKLLFRAPLFGLLLLLVVLLLRAASTLAQRPTTTVIELTQPFSGIGLLDIVPYWALEPAPILPRQGLGEDLDGVARRVIFDPQKWMKTRAITVDNALGVDEEAERMFKHWSVDPGTLNVVAAFGNSIEEMQRMFGIAPSDSPSIRRELVLAALQAFPNLDLIEALSTHRLHVKKVTHAFLRYGYMAARLAHDTDEGMISPQLRNLCQTHAPASSVWVHLPEKDAAGRPHPLAVWLLGMWPWTELAPSVRLFEIHVAAGSRGHNQEPTFCVWLDANATQDHIHWNVYPFDQQTHNLRWTALANNPQAFLVPDIRRETTRLETRPVTFVPSQTQGHLCIPTIQLCWMATAHVDADVSSPALIDDYNASSVHRSDKAAGVLGTALGRRPKLPISCDPPTSDDPLEVFAQCVLRLLPPPEQQYDAISGSGVAGGSVSRQLHLSDIQRLAVRVDIDTSQSGDRVDVVFFRTLSASYNFSVAQGVAMIITTIFLLRRLSPTLSDQSIQGKRTLQDKGADWEYAIQASVLGIPTPWSFARVALLYYVIDILLLIMLCISMLSAGLRGTLAGVSADASAVTRNIVDFATPTIQRYQIVFYILVAYAALCQILLITVGSVQAALTGHEDESGLQRYAHYSRQFVFWFFDTTWFSGIRTILSWCVPSAKTWTAAPDNNGVVPTWRAAMVHFNGNTIAWGALILFWDWNVSDSASAACVAVAWTVYGLIAVEKTVTSCLGLFGIFGSPTVRFRKTAHWWMYAVHTGICAATAVLVIVFLQLDLTTLIIQWNVATPDEQDAYLYTTWILWCMAIAAICIATLDAAMLHAHAASAAASSSGRSETTENAPVVL